MKDNEFEKLRNNNDNKGYENERKLLSTNASDKTDRHPNGRPTKKTCGYAKHMNCLMYYKICITI